MARPRSSRVSPDGAPREAPHDPARLEAAWRKRHAALFRRAGLARRIRHGAALSALMGSADENGLELQLRWALRDRVGLTWLRELLLQNLLFAGYPRSIQALQALARAAGARNDTLPFRTETRRPGLWGARGRALCARIYGDRFPALVTAMRKLHPDLAVWMIEDGYGRVLARPFLPPRVRELCVVALLVAQESWPQLRAHAIGARHVGASAAEIEESARTALAMVRSADAKTARRVIRRAVQEARPERARSR